MKCRTLHEMSDKLIDAECAAHYYSSMNFRALITALCLLSLSACVNRNSSNEVIIVPEADVTTSPESRGLEPQSETAVAREPNISPETLTEPNTEDVQAMEPDLIERIRQGFQLPEYQSKHIQQYERWSSQHSTYLKNLFTRAEPFLFHIVEEIEKRGLPMELALLPAIESAYKPNAVSRSSAAGLWQFVPATGRYFGLKQDWWYDGRLDTLSSTNAALDYLAKMNKTFNGDWFLTLAAYNAGPGTVSRAIKSNRSRGKGVDYKDLKLRLETRRYIPKLLALRNIIRSPEDFGVELPHLESKPHFQVVKLNGQIDLKAFAKDAGIDIDELRNLNAGYKRWATSPNGPHQLLIPIGSQGGVEHAALAAQRAPKLDFRHHDISTGESLGAIARRYGVSVKAIQTTNNMSNTRIRAGKTLIIPVRESTVASSSTDKTANPSVDTKQITHRVKAGDTLWSIAKRYQVQIKSLLAWNNISANQILRLNQPLLVMLN